MGSGPNGLAAAVTLARADCSVLVREAMDTMGGGARSEALTIPGFTHDLCSAVHPLAAASPFFRSLPLDRYGLEWIDPPAPLAHALDDGSAVFLERATEATASQLDPDARAYRRLMDPFLAVWEALIQDVLSPPGVPAHPAVMARFGLQALRSAAGLATGRFEGPRARALFAGLAAHSFLPLTRPGSAAFGLVLGLAGHAVGWPVPRGGAQAITDALAAYLQDLGGEIVTGQPVRHLDDLAPARFVFFDVTPRQLLEIAGDRLPSRYRRTLRGFRYGPAAFKVDWALSEPIPWRAADCANAGTVHLGGTLREIQKSEHAAWHGQHAEHPFVLLAQPSLFDPGRAPPGQHTVWAYCHVPHGSDRDMTDAIEYQIERFAPGFRDCVLSRATHGPAELERRNPNLVGGDISGGSLHLLQLLRRPRIRHPYRTPIDGVYLCSASTPPGPGVHGMCGHHAARSALSAGL